VSGLRGSSAPTRGGRAALLAVPASWALVLLLLPFVVMVVTSTGSRTAQGGVVLDGSFEAWSWLSGKSGLVARTAWRSARVAGLATALAVLLATPVAWWIAAAPPRKRALRLLLVVLPSWTSFLLRTYAWRFLFGNEGPVNALLERLSIDPVRFLNTETAVVVGLVYAYLPFAVLPIYVAVERLDRDLLAAARDLGAGPARTFASVAFPLTLHGTVAAAALVFVPSFAAFVTPQVLGGTETYMIGQLTQDRFLRGRDYPQGAALGTLVAVAAFLALVPLRARRPVRA
jgi:spermidine/putrescine transport system permease protein